MIKIPRRIKAELFNAILKEENPFGKEDGEEWTLGFLGEIWDLRNMPSEDSRFNDAYQDIYQHTINNDDWDLNYLFLDRLKLIDDDEKFVKFIETIVNPKFRESEDEIVKFVLLINSYLESEKYALSVSEYDENGSPIYLIQEKRESDPSSELLKNTIIFYVEKEPSGYETRTSSHSPPETFPAFVLACNTRWNDYGYVTNFFLFFYKSKTDVIGIGHTKITDGTSEYTTDSIPNNFRILDDAFCSLGQGFDFYNNLKKATGRNFESVLFALKDAAFFPEIHEKFEKNEVFKTSLIRSDESERLLREARHKIYDFDLNNLYSFKYSFQPKYADESIEVFFDFSNKIDLPNRIYAIIGKNGTGKTQLITSLPINISQKKDHYFLPRTPMFSKVIAVSYSVFDSFEIPKKTSTFNYVYCGLLNEKKELLSVKQQTLRFHYTWKKIQKLERIGKWRKILLNFIDQEMVDKFIVREEDPNSSDENHFVVNIKGFNEIKDKLSSGQKIILFIISEIISNIRLDSLILFDEPETHQHPNAISQLMNTIYDLVNEFESYCILTTHSPLVIQELFSRNVYVVERHENIPSIRKIGIESFGENLSTLTEEVFGNKEIEKQYKKIIDRLIETQASYSDIISKLESGGVPISLNVRMYVKSKAKG